MSMKEKHENPQFLEKDWFQNSGGEVRLMGTLCKRCKRVYFPQKPVCPDCFDGELEPVPLSRKGKLHTFAMSYMGPASLDKPYAIGFVDLPEGVKLYSILIDCDPWEEVLKVGMDMEMVIERLMTDESGNDIFSYKFRPEKREEMS